MQDHSRAEGVFHVQCLSDREGIPERSHGELIERGEADQRFMGYQSHTYMPAYLDQEFGEIMERSSHITFNSLSQWERFKDRVEAFQSS
jgi:diaminopimelate decarboxylase